MDEDGLRMENDMIARCEAAIECALLAKENLTRYQQRPVSMPGQIKGGVIASLRSSVSHKSIGRKLAASADAKITRKDMDKLQLEILRDQPVLNTRVPLEAITNSKPLNVTDNIDDWY